MSASWTASSLSDLDGDLDADRIANAATAAQASFSSLDVTCAGDSQVWGLTLDDRLTQAWPALIQAALASSAVTNRGINSANSAAILADLTNNIADPTGKTLIWMAGRNDFNQGLDISVPKANTQSAIDYWGSNPYLLITVPYQDDTAAGVASTTAITQEYNAWLIATFSGKVVDINTIYAANADPDSTNDAADVAADLTPRSLRNDYVHQNAAGHSILAQAILDKLAVLAPASLPVVEPKSLANLFGLLAPLARLNRANVLQRAQTFIGSITLKSTATAIGDGTGWTVGGIVGGVPFKLLGMMKFQGVGGAVVRASGLTIAASVSSSASDVTDVSATRTHEVEWSDTGWKFLKPVITQIAGSGRIASWGGNGQSALLSVGYQEKGAGTDLISSQFGPMTLWTQSNQNIDLKPDGTGQANFVKSTTGVIAGFGANNTPNIITIGYNVTTTGASEITGAGLGPLILASQNSKDVQLSPDGTGKVSISKALAVAGNFAANGATPAAKPTVTGSRADGTALASLLTALAAMGLITDSTTA